MITSNDSTPSYDVAFRMTSTLEQFTPVTVEEVDKLIGDAKLVSLNPVPIWLLKELCAFMSPFLSLLLNDSLRDMAASRLFSRELW